MNDTTPVNTETTEEEKPAQQSVGEMLSETPGSLTSGYIEACEAYDSALAETYSEEERASDELVTADTYAVLIKGALAKLGYDITDDNLSEQLMSLSSALYFLANQNGQIEAMMDPVGVAQRAYIVGLLSGIAAATANTAG